MSLVLPAYLGSLTRDDSVELPDVGDNAWFTEWESFEANLIGFIRKAGMDRNSIVLPSAGVALTTGQTATWALSVLAAQNPLLSSFLLPVPMLVRSTGTANRFARIVPDGTNWDVRVEQASGAPGNLKLQNLSGSTRTVWGLIYFPQYENYESSYGIVP